MKVERILNVAIALFLILFLGLAIDYGVTLAQGPKPDGPPIGSKLKLAGKNAAMVVFMDLSCPDCEASVPFLKEMVRERRQNKGIQVLCVVPTSGNKEVDVAALQQFVKKNKFLKEELPTFISSTKLLSESVTKVPSFVIIAKDGTVKFHKAGQPDSAAQQELKTKAREFNK